MSLLTLFDFIVMKRCEKNFKNPLIFQAVVLVCMQLGLLVCEIS